MQYIPPDHPVLTSHALYHAFASSLPAFLQIWTDAAKKNTALRQAENVARGSLTPSMLSTKAV